MVEEYNASSIRERRLLLTDFEGQKQQQQQPPPALLQQQDQDAEKEMLRGVKRQLLELLNSHDRPRPTPVETPASLGHSSLEELKQYRLFLQLDGIPGLPAVLGEKELDELSHLANEHQVVAFMMHAFEQILGDTSYIQVVNSEETPWLETTSGSSRFNQNRTTFSVIVRYIRGAPCSIHWTKI